MKCAILGYGTVGRGAAELLAEPEKISAAAGQSVELAYILVRHDYPGDPFADLMVQDFSVIEADPEVDVVAEVIGGVGAAYDYTRRALQAGKSVVTSNKELVAAHGAELRTLAESKRVSYLFEGSVCGGIPLVGPLSQDLAANRIDEIYGILNGTTNYILTTMETSGRSFTEALQKAQQLGYAEADPTDDVEGLDACRKIAILADLAFGHTIDPDKIPTQGITGITSGDLELAQELGYTIKLLGRAIRTPDGCCAFVAPHLVPQGHMLAAVSGVMNACTVLASNVGEVLFYGPGAGKRPTASSVVADIAQAVRAGDRPWNPDLGISSGRLGDPAGLVSSWYVRTEAAPDDVLTYFEKSVPLYGSTGECGFITEPMSRTALAPKLAGVQASAAYRALAKNII
jgi:Homoserine dehydrogenase